MHLKISAHVNGGPSGGSCVRRPGREDPHRCEQNSSIKSLSLNTLLNLPLVWAGGEFRDATLICLASTQQSWQSKYVTVGISCMLVRVEYVRHLNEVAILIGHYFAPSGMHAPASQQCGLYTRHYSFSLLSELSARSPRKSYSRVTKFCMGSQFTKILGFQPTWGSPSVIQEGSYNLWLPFIILIWGSQSIFREWSHNMWLPIIYSRREPQPVAPFHNFNMGATACASQSIFREWSHNLWLPIHNFDMGATACGSHSIFRE